MCPIMRHMRTNKKLRRDKRVAAMTIKRKTALVAIVVVFVLTAGSALARWTGFLSLGEKKKSGQIEKVEIQNFVSPSKEYVYAGGRLIATEEPPGTGVDTIGLYNPSGGAFFLRNSNTSGIADVTFSFGPAPAAGFIPIAGDWNGDGVDSTGLYDPATGAFFLRNSNSTGSADVLFNFGAAGLKPICGDWDGL